MKYVEGIGGNKIVADYREKKYGPSRRLTLAFIAILALLTMYVLTGIEFVSGAGLFIPQ
jgi:hypothetical protein